MTTEGEGGEGRDAGRGRQVRVSGSTVSGNHRAESGCLLMAWPRGGRCAGQEQVGVSRSAGAGVTPSRSPTCGNREGVTSRPALG